jgi:tripartite-type tricarboxylate transporter receptor subunit TctC
MKRNNLIKKYIRTIIRCSRVVQAGKNMMLVERNDTMLQLDRAFTLAICALSLMTSPAGAEISGSCKDALTGQRLTLIVPTTAGGGYDTYGRALAPVLDELTGLSSSVVNMPAGGGLVALTTLANSEPEKLVLMVESGTEVLRTEAAAGQVPWFERVEPIAVFYSEPSAWLGRADLVFVGAKDLVATGSPDNSVEVALVGRALGMDIKFTSGYSGSKEKEAAVLRGEADLVSFSLTSGIKSAKSGDLALKLLLLDKPSDRAPDVPHIAGENGLAATLAKDLAPAERARRIEMAGLIVNLSYDVRAVFTHRALRADLRQCLSEAVGVAIRSPAFAETAEAQGRPVAPMEPAEVEAMITSQIAAMARLKVLSEAP